jgi:arabinofuranan 3-O-arabinosyltransferase
LFDIDRLRRLRPWDTFLFALLTYVPFFTNNPGKVSADTKAYLYLDPTHLLATATSMWNADQGFGMVTHQNIGYLFPMGPFFWLTHTIGIPTWIAQRFWMGSLLFLAGLGVRKASQELGLSRIASWSAALPYVFTPFILVNIGRTSAILMPWAGLGWLILFAVRSARFGGWKNPARFALVVALVGGVNATSILLVGLAPAVWLLFAALTKEISWRALTSTVARIGLLCTSVSLWWIAGLWAEGKFGINILQYTETIPTVASTSSSSEVFRGLGYWYFYGWDHSQAWTSASVGYTTGQFAPIFSLILPTVAVIAALFVKWRYRTFAVLTVFLGLVIAVGAYPYNSPTPAGSALKWFGENTTVGLAMRSTNRVVPIMVLGLGLLLGAGVDALRSRHPNRALPSFGLIFLAATIGLMPLFNGTALATNLSSSETLPSYVTNAAKDLNSGDRSSGVFGLPGLDFGFYRWGAYVDSAWPGLLNRPFVTSQITLQGQPASVNLVRSLDNPIQDLIALPGSIAPIARLLGTGDVLFQFDTQFDRFSGPEPWYLWQLSQSPNSGLVFKKSYGPVITDEVGDGPFINESNLALPHGFQWPRSLAIYGVDNVRQLVRIESSESPAIVAGDGEGLVNMAGLGILPEDRAIFYDGALTGSQIERLTLGTNASLYITDSNQRRLNSYGVLHSSPGYVQQAGEKPIVKSPSQQTLLAYPDSVSGAQTVAVLGNIKSVQASSYGNPIANNPEVQPYYALDGSVDTAWQTSAFGKAPGQFIQIDLGRQLTFNRIRLTQVQSATINRWITRASITVDGKSLGSFEIKKSTRSREGGVIKLRKTTGSVIRIVIDATSHDAGNLGGQSGVGFAEIQISGLPPVTHSLMMPTSLLSRVGNAALVNDLRFVMTRARVATTPPRLDPELTIDRMFELPAGRMFSISGTASVQPAASDATISKLLGIGGSSARQITRSSSSSRLVGSLTNGPWAAFDGNKATSWMPGFQTGPNTWLEGATKNSMTISRANITFVNDGMHMVPTRLLITADGGSGGSYSFDTHMKVATDAKRGATQTLNVSFPSMTGRTFRLTVDRFQAVEVKDRISGAQNHPPIAITELNFGVIEPEVISPRFKTACRNDLISIDGKGVPVRVESSTTDALMQRQIAFTSCGEKFSLSAGTHHLRTAFGVSTGINIDNISLASLIQSSASAVTPIENLKSHWTNRWTLKAQIPAGAAGQYVAVGQSFGPGWTAKLDGVDLGSPLLIDGASMGWLLPSKMSGAQNLIVTWTPQGTVNIALLLSLLGLILCLVLSLGKAPRSSIWLRDSRPTVLRDYSMRRPSLVFGVSLVVGLCVSWWFVPLSLLAGVYLFASPSSLKNLSRIISVLIVTAGACTVAANQMHLVRSIEWPNHVPMANGLTWIALALWVIVIVATGPKLEAVSVQPANNDVVEMERRRGLNIPVSAESLMTDERDLLPLVVAPNGALRSLALLRAALVKRRDPDLYRRIVLTDAMNQVVGKSPLFNRNVLEIADFETSYAEGFVERGARVTSMRRETPQPRRGFVNIADVSTDSVRPNLAYTPLQIPSEDKSFDLVFATNVLSSVEEPEALINELVRVTRPGGSIYLQNSTWFSPWGGRETSPWHLISGSFARRRYSRKHGHLPRNVYSQNFFRIRISDVMESLRDDPRIVVVSAHPRYLPESFGWLLRVPIANEMLTMNLVVTLERTSD